MPKPHGRPLYIAIICPFCNEMSREPEWPLNAVAEGTYEWQCPGCREAFRIDMVFQPDPLATEGYRER